MKRFFILMIVSCMLLVGCSSSSTTEKSTTVLPECEVCHQTNNSHDWEIVTVILTNLGEIYYYKCRYCGNVIDTRKPIIRECFQK